MRFFQCLTGQELKLLGSVAPRFSDDSPHTPIGVLTGKMTVEECDAWRQQVAFLEGCAGAYFGRDGWARVTLELLEIDQKSKNYGVTVQDPQLMVLEYKKEGALLNQLFPFSRSI